MNTAQAFRASARLCGAWQQGLKPAFVRMVEVEGTFGQAALHYTVVDGVQVACTFVGRSTPRSQKWMKLAAREFGRMDEGVPLREIARRLTRQNPLFTSELLHAIRLELPTKRIAGARATFWA